MKRNCGTVAVALVCLVGAGCGDARKRIATGEEAQRAAEKRLADLQARHDASAKEQAGLQKKVADARAKAAATQLNLRRTLAAAGMLQAANPAALRGVATADALLAERFDVAAASGDVAKAAAVVAEATRDSWPCVGTGGETAEVPCSSTPYEDACAGVSEYDFPSLDWTCQELVKHAGAPTLAFCTSQVESRDPQGAVTFVTEAPIIRTAFFKDGRVSVSDWPAPSVETYHPKNVDGLATCRTENELRSCRHDCEVRFGRYQDPCAQSYGCGGCGDGDGPYGEDAPAEDPEVAAAREEARRAEAEAEAANERSRQAQEELEYQQCSSACDPSTPAPAAGGEGEGEGEGVKEVPLVPDRSVAKARLLKSPAPGVLVIEQDVVTRAKDVATDVETSTLLAYDDALADVLAGTAGDEAPMRPLSLLETFQDARGPAVAREVGLKENVNEGQAVVFATVAGVGPVLAGLRPDGTPTAWVFSSAAGTPGAKAVEQSALCAAVTAGPAAFGAAAKGLATACERSVKAGEEAAALKEKLAAVDGLAPLKEWRAALDASKLLTAEQKKPLFVAFDERRKALNQAEVQRLLERIKEIDEGESLAEWGVARTLDGATSEQAQALQKVFRAKEDELRKAGTLKARKKAGADAGASSADAGGAR
jgi:hypothetical protein